MTSLASDSAGYDVVEQEPPELLARNLRTGGHLWASANAFFFIGFLFAYFYLRSLDNHGMWHPKHVDAPLGFGTAIIAVVLLSVAFTRLGLRERRAAGTGSPESLDNRRLTAWRLYGGAALLLGLAAVGLQCAEYATLGFGPTDGGFASVFVGWTGLYAIFLLGTLFWLETLLATSFRYRRRVGIAPGEASGDPHRTRPDVDDPLSLVLPGLEAFSFVWGFLALIGIAAYLLLYVVS